MDPSVQDSGTTREIRTLREKVERVPLPSDLRQTLTELLERLGLIRTSPGYLTTNYLVEFATTSSYIHWVTSLPWESLSPDRLNLIEAEEILNKNHHGLTEVKERILEYLASLILTASQGRLGSLRAPILCFVGLAGTGKTTLASSIAQALGRNFERIPFGGMGDAQALRGQSKAFPDAEPGLIIKRIVHAKTKNCVLLLDEIDRVADAARADIMGVLVELLDPEQNIFFTDHYIDYPFDLSGVLFIATANNTTNVATAVLDRLELLHMPSYTDGEKITIGKDFLFPKIREASGLSPTQIAIDERLWPTIIRPLGFDAGIRSLARTIEGMCRKTARAMVEGRVQSVHITSENVKEYLHG